MSKIVLPLLTQLEKTMTTLTTEQAKRVNQSIVDTRMMIANEMSYSDDLQNKSRIADLEAHIEKLNSMLLNGWNAPKFN